MKLILMNEWLGPGSKVPTQLSLITGESNRLVSFATNLPLSLALERILAYQDAYNEHYSLAVNFRLLSVTEVESAPKQLLDKLEVSFVEVLPQTAAEVGP